VSEEANKATVLRYFNEVLDGGDPSVVPQLFASQGTIHFPGRDAPFGQPRSQATDRRFSTSIHHLLAEGDLVVAHLTHRVSFGAGERFATRLGLVEAGGRSVTWDAMALFHFTDGKIDEEWVNRDELDVLAQLGSVALAGPH
jgi:ketosteroid isomerase-like protein